MEYLRQLTPTVIVAALLLTGLVFGLLILISRRQSRTHALADRFGGEYDRTVQQLGGRAKAEKELTGRQDRVGAYTIRALSDAERVRFAESWRTTLTRFVDSPLAAVSEADQLLIEVMRVRGFPAADFDQRAADLSVDYPRLSESYHAAHDLALKSRNGTANTEELRQALVHCRVLYDELVNASPVELAAAR